MYNDIHVFRDSLQNHLGFAARVETNNIYIGEAPLCIKCPKSFPNLEETLYTQQWVKNRQETVNNRFKFWGILKHRCRRIIPDHGNVFHAIVIITQISIDNGENRVNVDIVIPRMIIIRVYRMTKSIYLIVLLFNYD